MIYTGITERVINCAIKVHKALGNGFQLDVYLQAMAIEMACSDIVFEKEKEMRIFYRDKEIGINRMDFFTEGVVMVEVKAINQLEEVHLDEAKNHLDAYKIEAGLLLNFGAKKLQFKRVFN